MKLKITNKPILVLKKKNFILAAFNLAFVTLYLENKIKINGSFFLWNDGLIGSYLTGLKKIPGRYVIDKLKYNRNIKEIHVIGNLSLKSKKYLEHKSKKKIFSHILPVASVDSLKKEMPKLKKNNLYLITLPTPKQEQLAKFLSLVNKNYKIICIGGGLEIASGKIKACPKILDKIGLEFIWRLREDTIRRLIRLFSTFMFLLKNILNKKLQRIKFNISY